MLWAGQQRAVARLIVGKAASSAADADGFSVQKADQSVIDALDDFQRYAKQEAWAKAFAALNTAAEASPRGLIPADDGFFLPAQRRIREALVSLNPAGRQAYRLFNDAAAKQLLDRAGDGVTKDQLAMLRKAADEYFLSSVGDVANDRLGDALFESGDFAGAADRWQAILTEFPDSAIPRFRLLAKLGTALARLGRTAAFDANLATVRNDYAGQTTRIGGRDVVVANYLASLEPAETSAAPQPTTAPAIASTQPTTRSVVQSLHRFDGLPKNASPLWQVSLLDQAALDRVDSQLRNMNWGISFSSLTSTGVPVAADGRRIYCSWLGIMLAIDQRTGKLLWRTEPFDDPAQRIQMMVQYGQSFVDDSVTVAGDRLIVIRTPPDKNNQYNALKQLMCLDAATGRMLWSSANVSPLSQWAFGGQPLVDGDMFYLMSHEQSQMNATLLAIAIKNGAIRYQIPLGTGKGMPNNRGGQNMPLPVLRKIGDTLYVLTNNGALLAVDLASRSLDWAFAFHTPAPDQNFGWNPYYQNRTIHSQGSVIDNGDSMIFKETDNDEIYAVNLSGPSLLWKRDADPEESMYSVSDRAAALVGTDVSLLDLDSRALLWSAALPPGSDCHRPLVGDDALCLATSRGMFAYDMNTGDTRRIFRGMNSDLSGGRLIHIPGGAEAAGGGGGGDGGGSRGGGGGKLVAVSVSAVTAYSEP